MSEEGGDSACWLDRVCPECGRFMESETCEVCGRESDQAPPSDSTAATP